MTNTQGTFDLLISTEHERVEGQKPGHRDDYRFDRLFLSHKMMLLLPLAYTEFVIIGFNVQNMNTKLFL